MRCDCDWCPNIPNAWKQVRIKDIAILKSGDTFTAEELSNDEDGYPVYGGNGLRGYTNKYNKEGDYVLIGRQGALCGNINYAHGKFFATEHALVVNTFKKQNTTWLGETLRCADYNRLSQSAAQPGLAASVLMNQFIPYPREEERERMGVYLDDKTAKIDHAVSLLQKKRDAYTRLKSSIINRAVTRGLNPNVKLKDSGVDWIGKIPENWDLIPLKGNIKLMKGRTPSELTFENDDLPYLTMDYLRGRSDKSVMYPINSDGLIPINASEVLVLWDGANAGEFLLSKKGYLGSTMAMISVNERKYSKEYFFYLLKSIEPTSKYFANGTTIPHFSPDIFYGKCYPCPSIQEQLTIASYLDTHCSRIDHAISIVDKQIDAYTRLKKSLINEVVTGKRSC